MGIELMISPYFHSVTKQSKNFPQAGARSPRPLDFPSAVLFLCASIVIRPKRIRRHCDAFVTVGESARHWSPRGGRGEKTCQWGNSFATD